eukprot:3703733-Prymnesium_polylepis.1
MLKQCPLLVEHVSEAHGRLHRPPQQQQFHLLCTVDKCRKHPHSRAPGSSFSFSERVRQVHSHCAALVEVRRVDDRQHLQTMICGSNLLMPLGLGRA